MTLLIAILAVVFLVLTIMVISRTQTLMKGMEGETETPQSQADKYNDMNGIGLFIFWILSVIGVIWSFNEYKGDFLMSAREFWPVLGDVPTASSEHGRETDYWFWFGMLVITISFLVVNSVLFYFPFKYRFKEGRKAQFYPHNNTLEIIWTAIPAVVMAGLVFSGLMVWNKVMSDAPKDAEEIDIMGKQFGWYVRYAGVDDKKFGRHNYKNTDDGIGNEMGVDFSDENSFDDFTSSTEMHIPKGKAVLLKIRARDVLHSVFIPHMRVKMDAVPGMPTKFWFKPEKSTADMRSELGNPNFNYELACTEVCGRSHFGMRLLVIVDEPEEYEKWKREQKPLLTVNPAALDKVPENLKAKAMKYAEPDAPVATEATAGGVATSSSLK